MANRQALRELQDRLAQRLQVARAQGAQQSWLAVESAGQKLLIPLAQAGEIFPYQVAQPVPYTQPWFMGVANLRGGLYGVVDFAGFAFGRARGNVSDLRKNEMRLVVLNPSLEVNCAVVIDRLVGLRNLAAFSGEPQVDASGPTWGQVSRTDAQGATWRELDVNALVRSAEFLSVASATSMA
jgi:twitching motility protein PilI